MALFFGLSPMAMRPMRMANGVMRLAYSDFIPLWPGFHPFPEER